MFVESVFLLSKHTILTQLPLYNVTSPLSFLHHSLQNFVFASSSSVYGGSKNTYFSEEENVDNPVSPYAASKKACESLQSQRHQPSLLHRLRTEGQARHGSLQIHRSRQSRIGIAAVRRGWSSRDHTFISDIVDGILRAVDRPYPYQVFNLGKGSGTSLKEFISIVEKNVGKKAVLCFA